MNKNEIIHAVEAIKNGKLVVYPTDTLYALGTSIRKEKAVNSIFSVKKRSKKIPLPVAVSDKQMLSRNVVLTPLAKKLAQTFFPGKITLVCQKKQVIPSIVTAGMNTVAVRIPQDSIALDIIDQTGPLIVTSANIHGKSTPSTISEIRKLFKPGIVDVYIDDGVRQGKPSTIVDVTGYKPKILREGVISTSMILEMSGFDE